MVAKRVGRRQGIYTKIYHKKRRKKSLIKIHSFALTTIIEY